MVDNSFDIIRSMTDTGEYQEAEIVREPTRRERAGRYARDKAFEYGKESADAVRTNILWAGFGSLFIFFFVVFVVLAALIALILWLIPFAAAAVIVAIIVMSLGAAATVTYRFFQSIFYK